MIQSRQLRIAATSEAIDSQASLLRDKEITMRTYHRIRASLILSITGIGALALASTALAEAGEHHMHHKHQMPTYADIDANGDGGVDADEFTAFHAAHMAERVAEGHKMKHAKDAPTFDDLDLDDDGNLSAEEFATHHAQCPMHSKMGEEKPAAKESAKE
jgi:hypothetical protein